MHYETSHTTMAYGAFGEIEGKFPMLSLSLSKKGASIKNWKINHHTNTDYKIRSKKSI